MVQPCYQPSVLGVLCTKDCPESDLRICLNVLRWNGLHNIPLKSGLKNPASHTNYGGGSALQLWLTLQWAPHFLAAAAWTMLATAAGFGGLRVYINYKSATLAYKVRSVGSPTYLLSSVSDYATIRNLQLSSQYLLSVLTVRTQITRRAFSHSSPSVWNDLLVDISSSIIRPLSDSDT
jgi:hypothetical protein